MENIINEYHNKKTLIEDFKFKIEDLLHALLREGNVKFHQITSRVKTEDSLKKKIESKNGKYNQLFEITDIIGFRIITYFEDEVDMVAKIIDDEFEKNKEKSVDKRIIETDKFGYQSLHYIIESLKDRTEWTEWKKFKSIPFEIQIRSILQHAWAEIEHDIGYKGQSAIPEKEKRNFFRIAALLETADKEFIRLRTNLLKYENEVSDLINKSPEEVLIDKVSLISYIANSDILKVIEKTISENTNCKITSSDKNIGALTEKLNFVNVNSIKELEKNLIKYKDFIISLATNWLKRDNHNAIISGISIFYLPYAILVEVGNIEAAEKYFLHFQLGYDEKYNAKKLFEFYENYTK